MGAFLSIGLENYCSAHSRSSSDGFPYLQVHEADEDIACLQLSEALLAHDHCAGVLCLGDCIFENLNQYQMDVAEGVL